ncbi:MAG TPA: DUF917 family protein [Candidatus Bathyarchaeota archaeon]|nr:DUF917 family protein [Candidatus Bathyarchaeota archaeon]
MPRRITAEDVEALALGGAILGGGGGGSPEGGRRKGLLALEIGDIWLYQPDELPEDTIVATIVALGAPTQRSRMKPSGFIRAAQLLWESGIEFEGVIAAENGGYNSFGGWLPAAALELPVVDAPCDGRAHPTAVMGSMGLHRLEDYRSVKAIVAEGVEVVAWGSVETTSRVARLVASERGMVAMARDPVALSYAVEHGAPGAVSKALELGHLVLKALREGAERAVRAAMEYLGGSILCRGRVRRKHLETRGGFDVGLLEVEAEGEKYELTFLNEYMTLERGGRRLATFPDLISTFDDEGRPITSAAVEEGDEVYVTIVPRERIPIGDGLRYSDVYRPVEEALGKAMTKHLKGFLIE